MTTAPLIIDTDIGGEPDDAMTLAIAARSCPELALVLTTDEAGGQRARFARAFLDLLGRPDVPVVAGARLSDSPYFWIADLIPTDIPAQPTDPVAAVAALCDREPGPVRWLGLGPMSNLAAVLASRPGLANRLELTQMGGALAYRDPTTAQYNFRLDPAAARAALTALTHPRLVTYDVTFAPDIAISAESQLYQVLADSPAEWATALVAQCDLYYAGYYPSTIPHTPLTLSAALGEPFVQFESDRVAVDEIGRTRLADNGEQITISTAADHAGFATWLSQQLDPAGAHPAAQPG
ncbi:nucleoside hydrolase [Saccharopolyspora phatthalungensis]|uniref:Inosine-uridine nucleoside N-ribohydrolase n=1 Tax=Saccharopolyspora phatthalungensis TaxID=664693 RepID=A0A840QIA8_9PSEU|nr:nucleoside hydrolase [Saccharopolyspora phatthalungensis]MBB5159977.1 inosine-uridine nucleoside N-ribohydrolase [Saccharopolyspora phatthalungensis]